MTHEDTPQDDAVGELPAGDHFETGFGEDHATFGDRLVAAREAFGLTSAQLARRLGVREASILRWEEDRAEPRSNRLQMLAGILNVSLVWLMTGEGEGIAVAVSEDQAGVTELLGELSAIRADNHRLAERCGRLEKRLRAHLLR